ncbi:SecY protein transport family protein [Hibiscus syriacus]|uniref:SecY protein transport family protein n=1 Tax=Hibiscus syriacus TaxID=106335 RepID=A0A6A3ATY5_HIBSY|nr:SecY protein transport family protein [Hibiscus syriacus]
MAVAAFEDIEVVSEEPISWLPSHVVDEPISETNKEKDDVKYHYHRHRSKLPTEPSSPKPKSRWRRHDEKPRDRGHWAPGGGGGMQAFFLHSGNKSTGTGVFLPQTQYNNNFHSSRRPPCSPVLLPSRVVQALNLNVHQLGLQISPRTDTKNNNTSARGGEWNSFNNKNGKDASPKRCVSGNENSSAADILLPDEWTY